MPHRIIRTPSDLDAYIATLRSLNLPMTVQHKQGADRSLDQNHLQFLWANEFAAAMGDRTCKEVRLEWKLRHGVPILRAEDEGFRRTYDANIKGIPYVEKLRLMELIPVTSLMTVKQMTAYLDTVQREAAEHGVRLTDPDPQASESTQKDACNQS